MSTAAPCLRRVRHATPCQRALLRAALLVSMAVCRPAPSQRRRQDKPQSSRQGPLRDSPGLGTAPPGAKLAPWPHAKAGGGARAPMVARPPNCTPGPGRIYAAPSPSVGGRTPNSIHSVGGRALVLCLMRGLSTCPTYDVHVREFSRGEMNPNLKRIFPLQMTLRPNNDLWWDISPRSITSHEPNTTLMIRGKDPLSSC